MSELLKRLQSAGSIKSTEILSKSHFFNEKDMVTTEIPIINIALSGKIDGGLTPGLTFLAGPSKHFKSLLGLMMIKAYMNKYPDSICLFYDSEFGITPEYISANGIDSNRVLHIPIEHLEQLKFDISKRLDEIKRGDKVIIFMDSVGNLASKKEVEDALEGKSVADMTRARVLKSLFRIITPHFTTKDIPCIVVNHTYQELALYPKTIMSGGTGPMYSANQVFIIGKSQEKEGTDIVGWNFTINIEKSRFVKEKSKLPFLVTYEGGINKWSGLLDIALDEGVVIKPSNGWYSRVDLETGEVEPEKYRLDKTNTKDFWLPIITHKKFQEMIKNRFQVSNSKLISDDYIDEEMGNIVIDEE
jgi:RecA/RadA recombinase